MNTFTIISMIISIISIVVLSIYVLISKRTHYKTVGTIHVDLSREDKDICLFTLDMPLNEIAQERYVIIRVDGESNLREWTK